MVYYCPSCNRVYDDLMFKYCPVCNVKIKKRPADYSKEIEDLKLEIKKLNHLINDYNDKLSNSASDEESVIYRKQLLDNNRKLKECQDKLDELTQKTYDEKISIKREKDYELISSFSDEVLKDMNSNFKNFNYSAREDIINLLVDFGLEYIEKAINHFELKDYENVLNMLIKQFHIVKQNLHGFIKQSIIWHWVI